MGCLVLINLYTCDTNKLHPINLMSVIVLALINSKYVITLQCQQQGAWGVNKTVIKFHTYFSSITCTMPHSTFYALNFHTALLLLNKVKHPSHLKRPLQ